MGFKPHFKDYLKYNDVAEMMLSNSFAHDLSVSIFKKTDFYFFVEMEYMLHSNQKIMIF